MTRLKIKTLILLLPFFLHGTGSLAQSATLIIKGTVTDIESKKPLSGASVYIPGTDTTAGTITDSNGNFRIGAGTGRVTLVISHIGYEEIRIPDILVSSGKEVYLTAELREKVFSTKEVFVTAGNSDNLSVNQMAIVSTHTIRANDALRFAGGFYDPSRIVNSFAGVATTNSDESNDIIIRGNSSRGLLWRLEGIEIPNPNHFGDGQGGSGGAYAAITSNVISTFDFFTGAFPAEYGNAISGVMDLNLRKGNYDRYEFAFQTGMIGAEVSAEGPLNRDKGSSFLINARYANFSILSSLNLIDLGSTNYAPRSQDLVFNVNLPGKKAGNLNIFGFHGKSSIGKKAVRDTSTWENDSDRWEEIQTQSSSVLGIKHLKTFRDGSGYIRSVAAFTDFNDTYSEGYVDSSFMRSDSYHHNYNYPSAIFSFLLNSKLSQRDIFRTGLNIQFLWAAMDQWRVKNSGEKEVLVDPSAFGILYQLYFQFRNRITEKLELNSGIHTVIFSNNGDISIEPRISIRWSISKHVSLFTGAGLHSRREAFPVYYNRIKIGNSRYSTLNEDLGFTRSLQFVSGGEIFSGSDFRIRAEGYYQYLFRVPIIDNPSSTYSSINSSEELPDADLRNEGLGYNTGAELTIEKSFSHNYYFLLTGSLFRSKYLPGNGVWYNTYYNTSFVTNLLAGRDFYFGGGMKNVFGINVKSLWRGGYRYTPVDYEKSIENGRIYYDISKTYEAQLPDFFRLDAGISFRRNNNKSSWIFMLDVQNLTGQKNIFRKRYSFINGGVVENSVYSLGAVPVINFRIEF